MIDMKLVDVRIWN